MIRIYTIGYEGRGPGTVLNALKERSVRWLVDAVADDHVMEDAMANSRGESKGGQS